MKDVGSSCSCQSGNTMSGGPGAWSSSWFPHVHWSHATAYVQVRGQLGIVGSLLPHSHELWGLRALNSGLQACKASSLPPEFLFFMIIITDFAPKQCMGGECMVG